MHGAVLVAMLCAAKDARQVAVIGLSFLHSIIIISTSVAFGVWLLLRLLFHYRLLAPLMLMLVVGVERGGRALLHIALPSMLPNLVQLHLVLGLQDGVGSFGDCRALQVDDTRAVQLALLKNLVRSFLQL